jgi:hypothetical protein
MRFPYRRGHSSLKEYKIYAVLNVEFGICYSPKWFKLMSGLVWFFYNNALVATYVQFPDHTNVIQLRKCHLFFCNKNSAKSINAIVQLGQEKK